MANYERTFKSWIWTDAMFEQLNPIEKLFYVLLHTGEETSDTSIFTITVKRIAYHLGLTIEETKSLITNFEERDLIMYDYENQEVLVIDYFKMNPPKCPLYYEGYFKDLSKVKTRVFIEEVAEIAKSYVVTISFLAALSDFVPINVDDYKIKPTSMTLEDAKTVQKRGRYAAQGKKIEDVPELPF